MNRELAAELGLSTRDIAQAANVLAGGLNVAKYTDEPGDGERYDIRLKAGQEVDLDDLSKIYLRNPNTGALVRLDTVAQFTEEVGPAVINATGPAVCRVVLLGPDHLGGRRDRPRARRRARDFLPPGYKLKLQGSSEQLEETSGGVGFIFLLAIALVYMILASQFNSFSAAADHHGGAAAGDHRRCCRAGDYRNDAEPVFDGRADAADRPGGEELDPAGRPDQSVPRAGRWILNEALLRACPRRLRPILMTSLTIIFAMLVPALGIGTAVELSGPLSVAVIGGMVSSTLLSLVVVPAVYSLAEHAKQRRRRLAALGDVSDTRGANPA